MSKIRLNSAWALGLSLLLALSAAVPAQAAAAAAKKSASKSSSASSKSSSAASAKSKASKASSASKSKTSAATKRTVTRRTTAATSKTRTVRAVASRRPVVRAVAAPPVRSFGQLAGLHETVDPLDLKSGVAYVMDQDTHEILLNKNSQAVLPIASITKLMTAMVVTEARLPMDEVLSITQDDVDTEKGSSSRLRVGTELTRGEMLHIALMSSENRAASALGRHYPGGLSAFVSAMNAKAHLLGMHDTRYVEPTGLSSQNQSSARDLAALVSAASQVPLIRELSTSPEHQVAVGNRQLQYHTTNRLVRSPDWDIGVQKTGYISEAGQCLVMQAQLAGRKLIMVLLDSAGKYSRIGDAERIRKWLMANPAPLTASATPHPEAGVTRAVNGVTPLPSVAVPGIGSGAITPAGDVRAAKPAI